MVLIIFILTMTIILLSLSWLLTFFNIIMIIIVFVIIFSVVSNTTLTWMCELWTNFTYDTANFKNITWPSYPSPPSLGPRGSHKPALVLVEVSTPSKDVHGRMIYGYWGGPLWLRVFTADRIPLWDSQVSQPWPEVFFPSGVAIYALWHGPNNTIKRKCESHKTVQVNGVHYLNYRINNPACLHSHPKHQNTKANQQLPRPELHVSQATQATKEKGRAQHKPTQHKLAVALKKVQLGYKHDQP